MIFPMTASRKTSAQLLKLLSEARADLKRMEENGLGAKFGGHPLSLSLSLLPPCTHPSSLYRIHASIHPLFIATMHLSIHFLSPPRIHSFIFFLSPPCNLFILFSSPTGNASEVKSFKRNLKLLQELTSKHDRLKQKMIEAKVCTC